MGGQTMRTVSGRNLLFLFIVVAGQAVSSAAELISRPQTAVHSATGNAESTMPVLSADGRYLLFSSLASDLVPHDHNDRMDVFRYSCKKGTLELVSVAADGIQAGAGHSSCPSASRDGELVAFTSRAVDLVPQDEDDGNDVYVRDLRTGMTTLVSVNLAGTAGGNGPSDFPELSADGRRVLFESDASDLVANDLNGLPDVFVRDLLTGTTMLVSANSAGSGSGNGGSGNAHISADGRWVVFESEASDLDATKPTGGGHQVHVRNLETGVTWLLPAEDLPPGVYARADSTRACISADGRYVAFQLEHAYGLLWYEVETRTRVSLLQKLRPYLGGAASTMDYWEAAMTPDGRRVLLTVNPHADFSTTQIWLWNADTDTALRVTTALDGVTASKGFADEGAISDDGNWVTFRSNAKDLVSLLVSGEPQIYQQNLQTGLTRLVSVDTSGNGLNPECFDPAVSADGRVVAFRTPAAGFVDDDANKVDDVFVTGPGGSGLRAASVRDPLAVSASAQALSFAGEGPVTADGRHVLFISRANDLVEGDANRGEDVFLMDLVSGTPLLVSANTNGLPANGRSTEALVSEDGRFVAFVSRATDLATNALRGARNLYLRDRVENRTVLVTRTVNGDDSTNSLVLNSISADGRWVVFTSGATNLVPGVQLKARWDRTWTSVYAYDRLAGTNLLVSVAPSGVAFPNGTAERGVISRDGRQVMFAGNGSGFSDGFWIDPRGRYSVYVRDLGEGKTRALGSLSPTPLYNFGRGRFISDDGQRLLGFLQNRVVVIDQALGTTNEVVVPDGVVTRATLSPDGRWVALEKRAGPYNASNPGGTHLWVCDTVTGGQVAVDLNAAGTGVGSGRSWGPELSRNGRYVVFVSTAEDLVPNDGNGYPDVFLRDLLTGATRLLSVNPRSNRSGNAPSLHPVWGADDRTVIFQSAASDLAADDLNQTQDVFRVRIENPDNDGDGMDDAWEVAQFGNLDQDGRDDADGDGMSDGAEFKAGTLPLQPDSCLRMLRVTLNEDETSVEWTAIPGRTYTVQSRSSIDANWQAAAASVTATGPTGSLVLPTAPEVQETYYRVMLVAP